MRFSSIAAALALVLVWPAKAGLFEDEEARKALMEHREGIAAIHKEIRRIDDELLQFKKSHLNLQEQNEQLLKQIAEMRGSMEHMAKQMSDMQRSYKDLNKYLEDRFLGLESRVAKLEPIRVHIDGVDFYADPNEKKDYEAALEAFKKGDFNAASIAFGRFAERYSRSGYLPMALFWSGNSFYALRKYKEAIQDFKQITDQFPTHPRVPESLLSMANCQIELKDSRSARKTLETLTKQYAGTEAATAAQERLSKLR